MKAGGSAGKGVIRTNRGRYHRTLQMRLRQSRERWGSPSWLTDHLALSRPEDFQRLQWERRLWRKYHVEPEVVAGLLNTQNHLCAVCGRDLRTMGAPWQIDHNHKTKEVRGVTCQYCNYRVLGLIERAGFVRVMNAIRYLKWGWYDR